MNLVTNDTNTTAKSKSQENGERVGYRERERKEQLINEEKDRKRETQLEIERDRYKKRDRERETQRQTDTEREIIQNRSMNSVTNQQIISGAKYFLPKTSFENNKNSFFKMYFQISHFKYQEYTKAKNEVNQANQTYPNPTQHNIT